MLHVTVQRGFPGGAVVTLTFACDPGSRALSVVGRITPEGEEPRRSPLEIQCVVWDDRSYSVPRLVEKGKPRSPWVVVGPRFYPCRVSQMIKELGEGK